MRASSLEFRVSTHADELDDDDVRQRRRQEIESQLRLLHEVCQAHGWTLVAESTAGGEKGTRTGKAVGRPRLNLHHDQVVELRRAVLGVRSVMPGARASRR